MTYEEAIKRIKPIVDNEAYTDGFQDACKIAVKAMELQVAKKPISKYKYRYGKTICPACETENTCRIVMSWEKYCPDCGQKLDWTKEE